MKLRTHVLRYAFSQYTYQITNTVISFRSYDIIGRLEKKKSGIEQGFLTITIVRHAYPN